MGDPRLKRMISGAASHVRESVSGWSVSHFVFDACLTGAIGLLVGWLAKMPPEYLVPFLVCLFGAIAMGFRLVGREARMTPASDRALRARELIARERKALDTLDVEFLNFWTWHAGARSTLVAMFGEPTAAEFDQAIRVDGSAMSERLAADRYLAGIEASIELYLSRKQSDL